jgi:hypothetical protein
MVEIPVAVATTYKFEAAQNEMSVIIETVEFGYPFCVDCVHVEAVPTEDTGAITMVLVAPLLVVA